MSKLGLYGLVRAIAMLGMPLTWWAWLLITLGAASAIFGILLANAQRDIKRLLAYSSIENMGIIVMGLGIGVLGVSAAAPLLATLGFAGALLHAINHSLFKSLLFLGAGSVQHATGTRNVEQLGGLLKALPWTGLAFLTGAVAICGLPPLNGFVSEYLIYRGAFHEEMHFSDQLVTGPAVAVPALAVVATLAFAGGLAVACFVKAFGIVFLGEPRSNLAKTIRPTGLSMRLPVLLLALSCFAAAALAPALIRMLAPSIVQLTRQAPEIIDAELANILNPIFTLLALCGVLLGLGAALAVVRKLLLWGRVVGTTGTWDCGYARPTTRIQYTGSSFAQPVTKLFGVVLRSRVEFDRPAGSFPTTAGLATETPDVLYYAGYQWPLRVLERGLSKLRWLQHGRIHLYVLYIAITILALMMWYLGFSR